MESCGTLLVPFITDESEGIPMKAKNTLLFLLILASISLLAQGCYTQLATTEEDEEYYP